jgi:hypothetical protein
MTVRTVSRSIMAVIEELGRNYVENIDMVPDTLQRKPMKTHIRLRLDTRTRPVRLAAIRTQAVRYPHPKNHN